MIRGGRFDGVIKSENGHVAPPPAPSFPRTSSDSASRVSGGESQGEGGNPFQNTFLRDASCSLLAHLVHLFALLLPSFIIAGGNAWNGATGFFAFGIVAAAILDGRFVPQDCHIRSVTVCDKPAMRVAQFVGIYMLVVFWMAQIESLVRGETFLILHVVGGLSLVVGITLRVQAIRTLQSRFVSDIQMGKITHDGIYAWLRHPSEFGLLLIAIGAPLLIGSLLAASAAAIVLLPISLWRMHRENVALSG